MRKNNCLYIRDIILHIKKFKKLYLKTKLKVHATQTVRKNVRNIHRLHYSRSWSTEKHVTQNRSEIDYQQHSRA